MTTLERPHDTMHTTLEHLPQRSSQRWIVMALVAVLALVAGGAIGWVLRGDDTTETPAIVLAGDGELTARQEQMLDVVRAAEQAWQRGDAAAVLARFAPTGTFEALGTEYRADDGTLATFVESGTWTSLDVLEPMLVHGDQLFTFHRYGGGTYNEIFTFTTTGELLITSQVIHT